MWNGNTFFDKNYKVLRKLAAGVPTALDNEPPRI